MLDICKYEQARRPPIDQLQNEAEREGFGMLTRLAQDWESGDNRFDGPGEALFVIKSDAEIVAIGGLNLDPYAGDRTVGRIRHVYVARSLRRQSVGRRLVGSLVEAAKSHFGKLRLRTDTDEGDRFYRALGFHRCKNENESTHSMTLASGN